MFQIRPWSTAGCQKWRFVNLAGDTPFRCRCAGMFSSWDEALVHRWVHNIVIVTHQSVGLVSGCSLAICLFFKVGPWGLGVNLLGVPAWCSGVLIQRVIIASPIIVTFCLFAQLAFTCHSLLHNSSRWHYFLMRWNRLSKLNCINAIATFMSNLRCLLLFRHQRLSFFQRMD